MLFMLTSKLILLQLFLYKLKFIILKMSIHLVKGSWLNIKLQLLGELLLSASMGRKVIMLSKCLISCRIHLILLFQCLGLVYQNSELDIQLSQKLKGFTNCILMMTAMQLFRFFHVKVISKLGELKIHLFYQEEHYQQIKSNYYIKM